LIRIIQAIHCGNGFPFLCYSFSLITLQKTIIDNMLIHRAFPSTLVLLWIAAVSAQQLEENCGFEFGRSATEINGCNVKLEEEHPCSFKNDGGISMLPALEDDKRTVDIQYHACRLLSQDGKECTDPVTYVAYGHAVFLMDGMLVQRQSGSTGATFTDRVCLLFDENDGKSPTASCAMECLEISDNMEKEIVLGASVANGLPTYGSVTRTRHVQIVQTGTRTSVATSSFGSLLGAALVSSFGMVILNI
jgi:hypothetical protein